jgi:hypothetical protein
MWANPCAPNAPSCPGFCIAPEDLDGFTWEDAARLEEESREHADDDALIPKRCEDALEENVDTENGRIVEKRWGEGLKNSDWEWMVKLFPGTFEDKKVECQWDGDCPDTWNCACRWDVRGKAMGVGYCSVGM